MAMAATGEATEADDVEGWPLDLILILVVLAILFRAWKKRGSGKDSSPVAPMLRERVQVGLHGAKVQEKWLRGPTVCTSVEQRIHAS